MSNYRPIRIDIQSWLERKFNEVRQATPPDVRICCPYCVDSKFRLYIAVEDGNDEKKGMGFCQNQCGSVNFYTLYRDTENLTDRETIEHLYSDDPNPPYNKISEIIAKHQSTKIIETKEKPKVVWPSSYVPLYNLTVDEWETRTPRYIKERKLTKEICDKYFLGYSLNDYQFGGRLIVPIYQNGEMVGYQGRAMHDGIVPKYRFMDGIKAGEFLFNLDYVPQNDEVILVEGVFDVWGMIRCGFPNTVASFGKHLTDNGVKTLITRFKSVLLFWDKDAREEIVELANYLDGMIQVRVSFMGGKDPDEADETTVKEAISRAEPYSKSFARQVMIDKLTGRN